MLHVSLCAEKLTEWTTRISLTSIQTTLFITSANVLFFVDENVFGFIPISTGFVSENWNIDFVQNFLVTSDLNMGINFFLSPTTVVDIRKMIFTYIWYHPIPRQYSFGGSFRHLVVGGYLASRLAKRIC